MLGPIIDRIEQDYKQQIKIGKMNVDENPAVSAEYGIMSIPTIVLFKDGKEVKRVTGVLPERNLKAFIDQVLATT